MSLPGFTKLWQRSFVEPQLNSETAGIVENSCLLRVQTSVHECFHECNQSGLF